MSTATMGAPPIIPAETHISGAPPTPDENKAFRDVFKSPDQPVTKDDLKGGSGKQPETPKKAPETKQEASKDAGSAKTAKQGSDAPEKAAKSTEKSTEKGGKQGRWEKLDQLKKPEEVAAEEEVQSDAKEGSENQDDQSQSTEDDEKMPDSKAQSRWMQLKAAEKELLSIKPSFDEMKKKLDGYEANGHIPEEVKKRMEAFEQRYAEELLDSDKVFQDEVMSPIERSWGEIGDVAKEAGLDQTSAQALMNAVREMSGVTRSLAIRRIIAKATTTEDGEQVPLPEETIATLSQLAISAANDLHNTHWPREAQKRMEARDIARARRGLEVEEGASQKEQRESQYSEEAKRISSIIKDKMPLVFEQHPDALEAILEARPSSDIADQVFDAQSGHLVNYLAKTLNDTLQKLAKVEASLRAREKAKPGSRDGLPAEPKKENVQPSFEEVFGVGRR